MSKPGHLLADQGPGLLRDEYQNLHLLNNENVKIILGYHSGYPVTASMSRASIH